MADAMKPTHVKMHHFDEPAEGLRQSEPGWLARSLAASPPAPMTAVDHAELKRLEAELVQMLAPDQGESAHPAFGHAVRIQNAHDALLSEIEGLKAALVKANAGFEEYERRFYLASDDVDRLKLAICGGEDAPGAINAVSVEDCGRFIAEERSRHDWSAERQAELDALRSQAPDSWRPIETAPKDGETVLIFTPGTFPQVTAASYRHWPADVTHWMPPPAAPALRPQTAES